MTIHLDHQHITQALLRDQDSLAVGDSTLGSASVEISLPR